MTCSTWSVVRGLPLGSDADAAIEIADPPGVVLREAMHPAAELASLAQKEIFYIYLFRADTME
jgi:hypothetical protein